MELSNSFKAFLLHASIQSVFDKRITEVNNPSISPWFTTAPVESSTDSGLPPVRYVITGVPHAIASRFVVG